LRYQLLMTQNTSPSDLIVILKGESCTRSSRRMSNCGKVRSCYECKKVRSCCAFAAEHSAFNDDLVQDPRLLIKSLADAAQPEPVCNRTSTSRLLSFSFTFVQINLKLHRELSALIKTQ